MSTVQVGVCPLAQVAGRASSVLASLLKKAMWTLQHWWHGQAAQIQACLPPLGP